ncbi:transposase [Liquorilactobacillus sicerae]|uniref:transposase n=1 Tax=Liquorilactobacillus sicerae TaxID=1416943 RepID=UPI003D0592B0
MLYKAAQQIQVSIKKHDVKKLCLILNNYQKQSSPMDASITTLKKNLKYISSSCESAFSNGPIEGINRKTKALKRICYGFKNIDHFLCQNSFNCKIKKPPYSEDSMALLIRFDNGPSRI